MLHVIGTGKGLLLSGKCWVSLNKNGGYEMDVGLAKQQGVWTWAWSWGEEADLTTQGWGKEKAHGNQDFFFILGKYFISNKLGPPINWYNIFYLFIDSINWKDWLYVLYNLSNIGYKGAPSWSCKMVSSAWQQPATRLHDQRWVI